MTTAQGRPGPRGRWIIPVVLAVIIAAIVIAALFGSTIKSALMSSDTATPTPHTLVFTATPGPTTPPPGGPTATPGGGAPPTATPSSKGISTPLPGTTPLPTVPGVHVGMVTRPASRVAQIQSAASRGDPNFTYYLDPTQVLNKNLPAEGFTQGFTIVKPTSANPTPTPFTGADGRPVVKYYVRYRNEIFTVQVVQPGVRGAKGIWVIATVFEGQQ